MLPNYKEILELIKKGSTLEAQEKIIELREGALELQEQNFSLRERVRELETLLRTDQEWEEQKERYALVSPWRGAGQAYALKEFHSGDEQPHFLCTNCFHDSTGVVLNPSKSKDGGWMVFVCPSCKASIDAGSHSVGKAEFAEVYLGSGG